MIWERGDSTGIFEGVARGIAIGFCWNVEVVGGNVIVPHRLGATIGAAAALVAAILPIVGGALSTAATGQEETGARVGLWSGVVSGLA